MTEQVRMAQSWQSRRILRHSKTHSNPASQCLAELPAGALLTCAHAACAHAPINRGPTQLQARAQGHMMT